MNFCRISWRSVLVLSVFVLLGLGEKCSVSGQKIEMPLGSGTRLTLTPNERTVKKFVGDTYVVSCLNGASDTEWFSPTNDKINTIKISRVRQQLRRGGGGIDLFLQRVTLEDAGHYTCRSKASNVTFNFVVIKPITFDNSLAHQTALEGSSFTIKCVAMGQSTTPKLYWKVDQRSPMGPKFKVVKDGLVIHNVTKADSKRSYVCHAMDIDSPMPDVKSLNIALHVARKPMQVSDGDTITEKFATLGDWANFTCKIDSDPIPSFEWFNPSSTRLSFNDEVSIVNDIINGSLYSSTLQVKVTGENKYGNYVCRGGNDMGAIERTFMLRRGIKPSTPFLELETASPQDAKIRVLRYKPLPGEESIVINNKSTELPILDYVVETKLAQDSSFYPAKFHAYEQGFVLTGLLPGTSYHVRAALKNKIGNGNFSPPIQITTTETSSTTTSYPPIADEPQRINKRQKPCPPNLFQCKTSNECLSYTGKCNGIAECKDGSDEDPEMCRVALSSTYPSNIIDATEPSVAASRSVSQLAKSPLYSSPARRLFYSIHSGSGSNVLPTSLPTTYKAHPNPPTPNPTMSTKDNGIIESESISRDYTHVPNNPNNTPSSNQNQYASSSPNYLQAEETSTAPTYRTPPTVPTSQAPQVSSTNETTVSVSKSANNTQTRKTTNTVTTVTSSTVQSGKSRVVTTRKEIVITEKLEVNEL